MYHLTDYSKIDTSREQIDINSFTHRRSEQLNRVLGPKLEYEKMFLNSTMNKGAGDYSPSLDDQVERYDFWVNHPKFEENDRIFTKKYQRMKESYEKMGLGMGVLFSTVWFFIPGIRTLPMYLRVPTSLLVMGFCVNWGKNYGRDLLIQKMRPRVESVERTLGLRNFKTGF